VPETGILQNEHNLRKEINRRIVDKAISTPVKANLATALSLSHPQR
jgi:hypothetical protein